MLSILLHSSKTMRSRNINSVYQKPFLLNDAQELMSYLQSLPLESLRHAMKLSDKKAALTHELLGHWTTKPNLQTPAIDTFVGDIYSGLAADSLSDDDRAYANDHLYILSGLYGILRALDSIMPYRLEMGYRLPDATYQNLYKFWGAKLAQHIPDGTLVNLSSKEYTRALLPHLVSFRIITPQFLTMNPTTKQPTFVVIHAKIARGAFAHWMITNRITDCAELVHFNEIGYQYDPKNSTETQPIFVCEKFNGIGLSVRS